MYRTLVLLRHTFREAIVQPIYALLLALAAAIILIFRALPFFTLGQDTVMYESVCLDIILLFTLISTLFATSKSVYEEIEDRTMLTLMSKPVKRWEVLLGKYLGIITAALMAVAILGAILIWCVWERVPDDYQIRATLDDRTIQRLLDLRLMHVNGLPPSLLLLWLQISTLAAIGVALSTRFSLVVNLPTVILLYLAGNLTRFMPLDGGSAAQGFFSNVTATVLPFLQTFDLRHITIYRELAVPGTEFADAVRHRHAVALNVVWGYVGVATLYGVAYVTFALGSGLLLFQTRELGGAEG